MAGDLRKGSFRWADQSIAGEKKGERETCIFQGFFEKSGVKTWCFGGQFVVQCVVNVVFWAVCFES
jgi:hypothetical protein